MYQQDIYPVHCHEQIQSAASWLSNLLSNCAQKESACRNTNVYHRPRNHEELQEEEAAARVQYLYFITDDTEGNYCSDSCWTLKYQDTLRCGLLLFIGTAMDHRCRTWVSAEEATKKGTGRQIRTKRAWSKVTAVYAILYKWQRAVVFTLRLTERVRRWTNAGGLLLTVGGQVWNGRSGVTGGFRIRNTDRSREEESALGREDNTQGVVAVIIIIIQFFGMQTSVNFVYSTGGISVPFLLWERRTIFISITHLKSKYTWFL